MYNCTHLDTLETFYEWGDALQQRLVVECTECGARCTVDPVPHNEPLREEEYDTRTS